MMSACSSIRMQSTSCCLSSACDAASTCFNAAWDMARSLGALLPVYLAADLAAPQIPGALACGLVDDVREPALLLIERGDRCPVLERHGPVLDAGIDLGVDGAKYRRLQRRPAGHAAVRAHEHDVLVAHDLSERRALGRIADQHVGGAELVADVEHGDAGRDKGGVVEHRL